MANHGRFDPFGDFAQLNPLRGLDELLRDMGARGGLRERQGPPPIALDVAETDQAYQVRAELPGVKKEDIKVEVHGNRVSIAAESRREATQEGSRAVRSELYYGQQQRSFTLEQDIDDTAAQARYVDGILELTLPKKTAGGAAKVQVQ